MIQTIGVEGPHGNEREEDDESILIGAFFITLLNVDEYLKEPGPFAIGKYDVLAEQVDFDMVEYQRDDDYSPPNLMSVAVLDHHFCHLLGKNPKTSN